MLEVGSGSWPVVPALYLEIVHRLHRRRCCAGRSFRRMVVASRRASPQARSQKSILPRPRHNPKIKASQGAGSSAAAGTGLWREVQAPRPERERDSSCDGYDLDHPALPGPKVDRAAILFPEKAASNHVLIGIRQTVKRKEFLPSLQ